MRKHLYLIASLLLLNGCGFDEQHQYHLRYPATLIVVNASPQPLHITSLGSAGPVARFVFTEQRQLGAGQSYSGRIDELAWQAIKQGQFSVYGACGDNPQWQADGQALQRSSVQDSQQWTVTVSVQDCGK